MLTELNLQSLASIDEGRVDKAFARHLKRAIQDCEDRPGDKKPRKITVTALVSPIMLQDGAVSNVSVECEISSTVPKHVSRLVECTVKHGGRALFNDLSEDDIKQRTIDEA